MKRGQGATDYLLLVAVVLLIGVIVASLVALAGTGGIPNARKLQSDAYWRAMRPFGILDSALNPDGTLGLYLQNTEGDGITITGISLDGQANPLSVEFAPGETLFLNLTNFTDDCSYDVILAYTLGELDLNEDGVVDMIPDGCDPNNPPQQCVSAGGSSSEGTCCSGLVESGGVCVQITGGCTDNSECLSGRCTFGTCSATSSGCDPRCQASDPTVVCSGTWEGTCTEDELSSCNGESACDPSEYVQCAASCLCIPDAGVCDPSNDLCCNANCNSTTYTCGGAGLDSCLGESETCDPSSPIEGCGAGGCAVGLFCNPDGNGTYACGSSESCISAGQGTCTADGDCCIYPGSGSICSGGICNTCGSEGPQSCSPIAQGQPSTCCPGLACSFAFHGCTSACVGLGDICSGSQTATCCSPLTCDSKTGTCIGTPPSCQEEGWLCDNNCCEGLACDDNGVCAICADVGSACSGTTPCCGDQLLCEDDICTTCADNGQYCDGSTPCCDGEGVCYQNSCSFCSLSGEQCLPGYTTCCSGSCVGSFCQ